MANSPVFPPPRPSSDSIWHMAWNQLLDGRGGRITEPIHIEGYTFHHHVDLSECRFEQSLRIERCHFLKGLKLADAHIKGLLSLRGCEFRDPQRGWQDWRRLRVDGLLDASEVAVKGCLDLSNLRAGDDVCFDGLHAKALNLIPARWKGLSDEDMENGKYLRGRVLHLAGASITNHLMFQNTGSRQVWVQGKLDLRANVIGQVTFVGGYISVVDTPAASGLAVDLESTTIKRHVFFNSSGDSGFKCYGQIDLRAKIGGQVSFQGGRLDVSDSKIEQGQALNLQEALVGESILFLEAGQRRFECIGRMNLAAIVRGRVIFQGAKVTVKDIPNAHDLAIDMEGADVGQNISFRNGNFSFDCTGQINLHSSRIGGGLDFRGGTVSVKGTKHVNGRAIYLSGVRVGSDISFGSSRDNAPRFVCYGQIDIRARIGGRVDFRGVLANVEDVKAANGKAICLAECDVRNSVFFQPGNGDRFECFGQIDLRAKIGGQINFRGALVSVKSIPLADGRAILLEGAIVGNHVFFSSRYGFPFICHGQIDLRARIGGIVDFSNARVTRADNFHDIPVINLNGSVIGLHVSFAKRGRARCRIDGHIDCSFLHALSFNVTGASFDKLFLQYATILGPLDLSETTTNGLDLLHATIRGDLILDNMRIGYYEDPEMSKSYYSLDGRQATIQGRISADNILPLKCTASPSSSL